MDMKPPIDWSPCQQKGEEHDWAFDNRLTSTDRDDIYWRCTRCGVVLKDIPQYA